MLLSYTRPRSSRLLSPREFTAVYEKAKRKRAPNFTLFILPSDKGYPRLGLSISRKNLPRAVDRNRIKRIIRESFRLQQHDLASMDIVVVVYKGAQQASNDEFRCTLEKQWPRKNSS